MKELCIESLSSLLSAENIQRVELCSKLSVGGLTPNHKLFNEVHAYCKKNNLKLMTMIRLREGNFIYHSQEIEAMKQTILSLKTKGCDGVVFGCLTPHLEIDQVAVRQLMTVCQDIDVTFHMAFDEIPHSKQHQALKTLHKLGIHRVLTHGGSMSDPIETCIPRLKKLIQWAKPLDIIIMPGGGITEKNLPNLQQQLNTTEWHGTKIARFNQ